MKSKTFTPPVTMAFPTPVKPSRMEQTLAGLTRRGWITGSVAKRIASAKDIDAALEGLVKSGDVSAAVARTIARTAADAADKTTTYDNVIDKHLAQMRDKETK